MAERSHGAAEEAADEDNEEEADNAALFPVDGKGIKIYTRESD